MKIRVPVMTERHRERIGQCRERLSYEYTAGLAIK
jgi:hypothetical protein